MTNNILKYIGGKAILSKWIISFFHKHEIYVEVFGGSGAVLYRKPKSKVEVYNDLDKDVVNFFFWVKNNPKELMEKISQMDTSKQHFYMVRKQFLKETFTPTIDRASRFFYLKNLSFSGDIGHGYVYPCRRSNLEYPRKIMELIPLYSERFRDVVLENLDFEDCIKKYDSVDTLFYCDPPYVARKDDYYVYDWSFDEHLRFFNVINGIKGRAIISYNNNPFIEKLYGSWRCEKRLKISYGSQMRHRFGYFETLYFNF